MQSVYYEEREERWQRGRGERGSEANNAEEKGVMMTIDQWSNTRRTKLINWWVKGLEGWSLQRKGIREMTGKAREDTEKE
jgi:hypothetical protein